MKLVQKAKVQDVVQMHQLINHFADRGEMLARSLSELYENIRDYFVVRQGDRVIGCAALHVAWLDLAEIKSVAVAEEFQRQDFGTQLIKACLREARQLGIPTVFCLTYKPKVFERLGFSRRDKMELPRKVWTECYHCSKFPNCDEIALVCNLQKEN